MKIKLFITLLGVVPIFAAAQAKKVNDIIRTANEYYVSKDYTRAAVSYQEALTIEPGNVAAKYNLAIATARMGKADEATKAFTQLAKEATDVALKNKSFYNKGAVLTQQKKLNESIEAYKQALRQDPDDKQARENLQKALLEQKKNNPPPKKDDKKKKEQQKKDKQQQPKMKEKEAEQRLDLLEQKEKEIQQRMQKAKAKQGGGTGKDW